MFFLALITLLAAIARTAFTNIVAYEAYIAGNAVAKSRIRLQTGIDFKEVYFLGEKFYLTLFQRTKLNK